MFKKTSRQITMWEGGTWLTDSARGRLEQSWAEGFRQHVLPLLLEVEEEFADLYGRVGRPNWSVARMLACCLLQELYGLSDQAALDALTFDLRWQHALGLESQEAYLSRRSLVGFRSRLVEQDPEMRRVRVLFERLCATAMAHLGLSAQEQRLDSTLVTSNIRVRGRVGLFRQTLEHFLDELVEHFPARYARLSPALRHWHGKDGESWGAHATREQQRAQVAEMAQWLYEIVETFAHDEPIACGERYQLVARLFAEQCTVVAPAADTDAASTDAVAGPRVQVIEKFDKAGANLRSPHDPDAGTGHKGVGYYVHVTETCRNESTELITDYEVMSAAHSDVGRTTGAITRLRESGRCPETLYADGGYPTPESLVQAQAAGVVLHAPVHRGRIAEDVMTREDFAIEPTTGEVVRCPAGHAPTRHATRHIAPERFTLHAFFDGEQCRACPQRARCPVRGPNNEQSRECRLDVSPGIRLRDATFVAQKTPAWQKDYRIRSGVEATMSELKRAHGLGRLRVRRRARVTLATSFKVTACNVKRWLRTLRAQIAARSARPDAPQALPMAA